jgi:hypothetical protein
MSVTVFDDIDRGDSRTFTFIFTIPGGDPTNPTDRRDPTTAVLTWRTPAGVESTPALAHPGVGVFTVDLVLDEELSYWGRIRGTGTITAVDIFEARVRTDVFAT